jgi:two-component system OmpR family response regulator
MNTKNKINVFIVEDNDIYAKSLQGFIIAHFPEIKIKIFPVGETCLMKMHLNPNIVIMDYFLNSKYDEAQNGLEIIKRIKAHNPQTNIIVLSAQENYNVVLDAIKQYGCFYVQKDEEAFNKVEQMIKNFSYKNNLVSEPSIL